jgi:hypothetical protein
MAHLLCSCCVFLLFYLLNLHSKIPDALYSMCFPDFTPAARYPDTLRHPSTGTARMGGTHGIGGGTHSLVPDELGGSFSNLCERRLVFELSQHLAPEQATRSLIHRYCLLLECAAFCLFWKRSSVVCVYVKYVFPSFLKKNSCSLI